MAVENGDQHQDFYPQKFAQELPSGHHFPRAYDKAELVGSTVITEVPGNTHKTKYELA